MNFKLCFMHYGNMYVLLLFLNNILCKFYTKLWTVYVQIMDLIKPLLDQ
jgi:hypothetical protein